jgi:hypothetical protein
LPPDEFQDPDEEDRLQIGTVLRDRFLLQEEAAAWSLGVVYKALDRRMAEVESENPHVAIKALTPQLSRNDSALRALQQEAAKGRCLTHPNIVRFIDLDREDELYFVVMEWLDGRSLAEILDENQSGGLDIETALDVVRQVGRALVYAHRCGVVHADVKPGNLIITPSGEVKVFDFGVARVRQKERMGEPEFDPRVLDAQTVAYSSGQVISGEEPIPADDVFSLGCLMYRLIAGHRVFGPRNAVEAEQEGMCPQRPQGLSDSHWETLQTSLELSRDDRFTSVDEFLVSLDQVPGGRETRNVPNLATVGPQTAKRSWKSWLILAAILVPVALFVIDRYRVPSTGAPASPAAVVAEMGSESEEPRIPEVPVATVADVVQPSDADVLDSSLDPSRATDLVLMLSTEGGPVQESDLVLREDGGGVTVELVRQGSLDARLSLRLLEVTPGGYVATAESEQLQFDADGFVTLRVGQRSARTGISMKSDTVREPDRQQRIIVRASGAGAATYAAINLRLEDDDQRAFESRLPADTVSFAVGAMAVQEGDTAAQIDVIRYKPGKQPLEVAYLVHGITATEGEDYFAEPTNTVSFAPGQRNARIFIPLVQDTVPEQSDTFVLELLVSDGNPDVELHRRIAVAIRDDDS